MRFARNWAAIRLHIVAPKTVDSYVTIVSDSQNITSVCDES